MNFTIFFSPIDKPVKNSVAKINKKLFKLFKKILFIHLNISCIKKKKKNCETL